MKRNLIIFVVILVFLGSSLYFGRAQSPETSWELLEKLLMIPGVSGLEAKVADYVESRMPEGVKVQRDDMDNVWFTAGRGGPHLLFLAHTDELGFIITEITERGTAKVRARGGFFPDMYEGRAVVVYTGSGQVEGIVQPRPGFNPRADETPSFTSEEIEIYFGVDSAAKAEGQGVSAGDQVTIKKRIVHLTGDLLAARGVDDRAGCAALLAAAQRIDWSSIKGRTVTFAWDVQEEIGLRGASRLAESIKADFVFPVDTFVSSDGPFESKRFGYTPLGGGAVLRAMDNSSITPAVYLKRIQEIAGRAKIPLQLGNTHGGSNDGSVFIPYGAVNIPLSWPGAYSHSFIEKIHRLDLEALADLITILVQEF
jgi:putative aminopeptidase FrvX